MIPEKLKISSNEIINYIKRRVDEGTFSLQKNVGKNIGEKPFSRPTELKSSKQSFVRNVLSQKKKMPEVKKPK